MIRALPALLLLAACAANDPLPRPENPAEAECRREAQNAPGAKDAFQRLQIQNVTARERVLAEAAAAERGAYLRCMRAKGLAAPGGVEPVRQPN